MDYKIVFLDIDGTILKEDHTYTSKTKDAIQQLQEQGIEVFFATGRPLHELTDLAESLNIHSAIGYNGGFAIYKDEVIVNEPIRPNIVDEVLRIRKELEHEIVMYSRGKNYLSSTLSSSIEKFVNLLQCKKNTLLLEEIDDIYGITVLDVKPDEQQAYSHLDNIRVSPVSIYGIDHAIDLINVNGNKGTAIQKVLQTLNIPKEQAIAFGDGVNDIEMLQSVGESFAMGNANPIVFKYAKHKTTTVDESGVYHGLKSLGLVK